MQSEGAGTSGQYCKEVVTTGFSSSKPTKPSDKKSSSTLYIQKGKELETNQWTQSQIHLWSKCFDDNFEEFHKVYMNYRKIMTDRSSTQSSEKKKTHRHIEHMDRIVHNTISSYTTQGGTLVDERGNQKDILEVKDFFRKIKNSFIHRALQLAKPSNSSSSSERKRIILYTQKGKRLATNQWTQSQMHLWSKCFDDNFEEFYEVYMNYRKIMTDRSSSQSSNEKNIHGTTQAPDETIHRHRENMDRIIQNTISSYTTRGGTFVDLSGNEMNILEVKDFFRKIKNSFIHRALQHKAKESTITENKKPLSSSSSSSSSSCSSTKEKGPINTDISSSHMVPKIESNTSKSTITSKAIQKPPIPQTTEQHEIQNTLLRKPSPIDHSLEQDVVDRDAIPVENRLTKQDNEYIKGLGFSSGFWV